MPPPASSGSPLVSSGPPLAHERVAPVTPYQRPPPTLRARIFGGTLLASLAALGVAMPLVPLAAMTHGRPWEVLEVLPGALLGSLGHLYLAALRLGW